MLPLGVCRLGATGWYDGMGMSDSQDPFSCLSCHWQVASQSQAGKSSTFLIFPEISNLHLASAAAGSCITSVSTASAFASSFCQHANISDMLHSILTKLGHNNKCMNVHLWHDQIGVKGHVGVTGVKKVIFTKNAISPTDYMVWSCDSYIFIS